jgi:hypothetical protein
MRAWAWSWLWAGMALAGCTIGGPKASEDEDDDGSGGSGSADGGGGSSDGGQGSGANPGSGGSGAHGEGGHGAGGSGDPDCYTEPLDAMADVTDIVEAYGGAGYKDQVIDAMTRRWPAGGYLLLEQKNDSYFAQFSDSSSWDGMVGWLDTLVHEETHLFNAYHAQDAGEAHSLFFREDLIVYLPEDQGFPRSEIYADMSTFAHGGIYADTYFTGEQGQRGFNELLDEATCYANEVPGLAVFGEYYDGGVSLRDGSAAFLYFIALYLRAARTEHSDFYDWAKSQPEYVQAVQTLWLRNHFFWQLADQYPNLGIDDAGYRDEAHSAENLAEIGMFIGRTVGDSNCLL